MWVQNFVKITAFAALIAGAAPIAQAQSNDRSPTLLIETGPSDNPEYRRMTCANGRATSISELRAYERKEAAAKRSGQTPETAVFCIKNVRGWEAGNKEKYLDPIFNGMPYAKGVN